MPDVPAAISSQSWPSLARQGGSDRWENLHVIVDTGSDVSRSPQHPTSDATRTSTPHRAAITRAVKAVYGSGYWREYMLARCRLGAPGGGRVRAFNRGGVELPDVLAGAESRDAAPRLCQRGHHRALSAASRAPPTPGRCMPCTPNVPRVFGLQCCAYDPTSGTGGTGALILARAALLWPLGCKLSRQVVRPSPNHASPQYRKPHASLALIPTRSFHGPASAQPRSRRS